MTTKKMGSLVRNALAVLSADYRRRVADLAGHLRPRIESGELAPWDGWDDRWEDVKRGDTTPIDHLEKACRTALAQTREEAHLVLAISPHGPKVDAEQRGATIDPRVIAGEAVALDVLKLGRSGGWYTPAKAARRSRRFA